MRSLTRIQDALAAVEYCISRAQGDTDEHFTLQSPYTLQSILQVLLSSSTANPSVVLSAFTLL
jgi:hypothetical protein